MSTRCNVLFNTSEGKKYLYRHNDGYPECTGRQIKAVCKYARKHGLDYKWVMDYLKQQTSEFMGVKRPLYEDTDCVHGDIDYLYTVSPKLNVYTRFVNVLDNIDVLEALNN